MKDDAFLVARVAADSLDGPLDWLVAGERPFEPMDPLDFLGSAELAAVYDLYRSQYMRPDPRLNIRSPAALLQYNRWVIVICDAQTVVAFACFKTTPHGLKLGLTASIGDVAGKAAVKAIVRLGLNVPGVYGEVSDGVERFVSGWVPEVHPRIAGIVLEKTVQPHEDGRHYTRVITNVGPKLKLLVGRPLLD